MYYIWFIRFKFFFNIFLHTDELFFFQIWVHVLMESASIWRPLSYIVI